MVTSHRVSTKGAYEQVYGGIISSHHRIVDILKTLASSNKLAEVEGLVANGDSRLLSNIGKEVHYSNAYMNTCSLVIMRTTVMDHAIGNLLQVALDMESTLSAHTHWADMTFLKQAALVNLSEVQSNLNLNLGGFYLFAGSKVDVQPVPHLIASGEAQDLDIDYYKGDSFIHSVMLSDEYCLKYGVTADNPAFTELIAGINLAVEAVDLDNKDLLYGAKVHIQEAYKELNSLQQHIRHSYAKADHYKEIHDNMQTHLTAIVESLEEGYDLDLVSLMGSYSEEQTVLESLQRSFVKINNMTLAKLL